MKKLSVMLMSLAAVASVSAAPVVKKGHENLTPKTVATMRQAKEAKAAAGDIKIKAATPAKKAAKMANYAGISFPLQVKNYAAAQAAATFDFVSNEIASATYYESENDWYIAMNSSDGAYRLYLDLVNSENPGNLEGFYTLGDMIENWTYLSDRETYDAYYFESLNVTVVGNDPKGAVTITGEGVTTSGETVSINIKQSGPIEPTSLVEIYDGVADLTFGELTNLVITSPTSDVTLNLVYNGIKGEFTTDAFDKTASYALNNATGAVSQLNNAEMTVAIDENKKVYVSAFVVTEDAVGYQAVAQQQLPVAGHIAVEAKNLTTDDLFGFIYFLEGSTDEYPYIQAMIYDAPAPGDYTDEIGIAMLDVNENQIDAIIIESAVISRDEKGGIVLDAEFYGSDANEYTLRMYHDVPAIANTVDLTLVGELDDICADLGVFQIMAKDEAETIEVSFVFDAYSLEAGNYPEISQYYSSYSAVYTGTGKTQMEWGYGDLSLDGDEFTFVGSCQAGDTQYNVTITGDVVTAGEEPEGDPYDDPDNDLDVTFTLDDIADFEIDPSEGIAYISARNDNNEVLSILFFIENELEEGIYPINETYEVGTVQPGLVYNNSIYPSMYYTVDDEGYVNIPLWYLNEGYVEVEFDENGNPSIEVEATNTYGREAHFAINPIELPTVAIENVAAKNVKTGKFMEKNSVVIRTAAHQYNAFGQIAK